MTRTTVEDAVAAVEEACVAAADNQMREAGFSPAPQVHLFVDDWDPPYAGFVVTRLYQRGGDAVEVIKTLGTAAAAATATRVLVVWEESDLRASLYGPGPHPDGLACVIASILNDGHTLHWYPYTARIGAPTPTSAGIPTVHPEWGQPVSTRDAELPPVIGDLLHEWRTSAPDAHQLFARLVDEGYSVRFVER